MVLYFLPQSTTRPLETLQTPRKSVYTITNKILLGNVETLRAMPYTARIWQAWTELHQHLTLHPHLDIFPKTGVKMTFYHSSLVPRNFQPTRATNYSPHYPYLALNLSQMFGTLPTTEHTSTTNLILGNTLDHTITLACTILTQLYLSTLSTKSSITTQPGPIQWPESTKIY